MGNIQIAICDTDPVSLSGYQKVCQSICRENGLSSNVIPLNSANALRFEMQDSAFCAKLQVLIIDPECCGDAAAAARAMGYQGLILFVSNSMDISLMQQALDVRAYNFVSKGDLPRFSKLLVEMFRLLGEQKRQYIAVSCGGEYRQIELSDIYYFETTMDHMVHVWYAGGDFVFQSSLSALEKRLSDHGFFRAHRSFLVSLQQMHRLTFDQITLNTGAEVPVSRGCYAALKTALHQFALN